MSSEFFYPRTRFFGNLRKIHFWPPALRSRRFYWTGDVLPPTKLDRRTADNTMKSSHGSR